MKHIEINILMENVVIESNICNYFVKKSYLKKRRYVYEGTVPLIYVFYPSIGTFKVPNFHKHIKILQVRKKDDIY